MAAHQPHLRLSLDRPRCAIVRPQAASPDARRRRSGETLAYIWVRSMYRPPYVLDGLMLGAGALPLHEHYTDTGGATDHVFALCHLLGFRFVPRLRDIADRKLGSIAVPSTYKGIESLMGRTIKTAAIEADWDDIVRIVASIKEGAVAPSAILRKLPA